MTTRGTLIARQLRGGLTDAERRLWSRLRNRGLSGWKFRRQVPVAGYIADFLCPDVEVDGGQHDERAAEDAVRTQKFEALGYRVARYWNNEVMQNLDGVLIDLERRLASSAAAPHPSPLPMPGERE